MAISLLLVTFLAPSTALAQKPEPPDSDQGIEDFPSIENMPKPIRDVVQKATTLQESLTLEQHTALQGILDKHQPEMQATTELLFALGKSPSTDELSVNKDIVKRILTLFDNIEADMTLVLNAEQLSLYQSVINPEFFDKDMAVASSSPNIPESFPNATQGYTDYCNYSPMYQAIAELYSLVGYNYAYYSYQYYGSSYAYSAMVYASYSLSYGDTALSYSGQCYFETYYAGMMTYSSDYSYAYWAYYYGDVADDYGEYAYIYGYYDYAYYQNDYAYYNYVYNAAAYDYADAANTYAYYCYAYW